MTKKLLLLDCDGVIFDSPRLIDEYVQKIDYCASDKYCDNLNTLSEKCHNQLHRLEIERDPDIQKEEKLNRALDIIRESRKKHFYLKDMVLEEVMPKYQNIIDYSKIYKLENTYPGVIERISEIIEMGIFDDIYLVSHYNSVNEARAKVEFFNKYLPSIKVMLMKFHKQSFSLLPEDEEKNKKRERTNKILEFKSLTGIEDFSMTSFVDDSLSIIEEALSLDVAHCFCKDEELDTLTSLEYAIEHAILDTDKSDGNTRRGK